MINTLFLPELQEMLAVGNEAELREFCSALHPARTAEFMEGLERNDAWRVIQYADDATRAEIFSYFDPDRQREMLEHEDLQEVVQLLASIPADDTVDMLADLDEDRAEELIALVSTTDRRQIRRLQSFAGGTAGSIMTTEAAKLDERLTVKEALEQLGRQSEQLETIYYIYVVDDTNHLRGVLSTRMLVKAIGKPQQTVGELMDTDILTVQPEDDQQDVAQIVAKYDLLAIPVVDAHRHMLGIITHDDVIDVLFEEATEDVQRIAAVEPLEDSYIRTPILTLAWKRGMWLAILFFCALLTAFALGVYEDFLKGYAWLWLFVPLVIGSGGNSGAQSATLIIAAMATGDVRASDWTRIVVRELATGALLGLALSAMALPPALLYAPSLGDAIVLPLTVLLVVLCGTLTGSILPLVFSRIGWDPALMSNPFVAGINDILGIVVYVTIAKLLLT